MASDDKLAMAHVYAPLKFPTSIRIFVLLPGHGSEPIEGELSERDLSDEEPYEAVSYTWGSGFPDSRIYIHDRDRAKTLMVYPALESALKALRLPGSPRRLWVDAICTNTLDCDERNRVLAMIPDIFQNACKVCVWLGEAAHDTVLAFQLIRGHLLQISELDEIISDTSLFPNWVAFSKLLRRPWFSEKWVIQEISYSRNGSVYCGKYSVEWDDFTDAVRFFGFAQQIWRNSPKLEDDPYEYLRNVGELPASCLLDTVEAVFHRSEDGRILHRCLPLDFLVTSLAQFNTTNPRDSIYSLLGLAQDVTPHWQATIAEEAPLSLEDSRNNNRLKAIVTKAVDKIIGNRLVANYRKPFIDVCVEFINFSINSREALDIICTPWAPVCLSHESDLHGTPIASWIIPNTLGPFRPNTWGS
jgi:hypothetical protein